MEPMDREYKRLIIIISVTLALVLTTSSIQDISSNEIEVITPEEKDSENIDKALYCTITVYNDENGEVERGVYGTAYSIEINNDQVVVTVAHTMTPKPDSLIMMNQCNEEKQINYTNIYTNKYTDIAIIETDEKINNVYELEELEINEGEKVRYIGFKNESLVRGEGIISRTNVENPPLMANPPGLFEVSVLNDSNLQGGISGGPVFNEQGKVIGHVMARKNNENTTDTLIAVENIIIKGVSRGLLSEKQSYDIPILPMKTSDNLSPEHNPTSSGLMVIEKHRHFTTPRMRENINGSTTYGYGDIITRINGTRISSERELEKTLIKNHRAGEIIKVTVVNENGQERQERIRLDEKVDINLYP